LAETRLHKKIFDFVIFSNLFIAGCAVLMIRFTKELFNAPVSFIFIGFVFFSTLASYSVHWYLTDAETEKTANRTFWLSSNKSVHLQFLIVSAVGSAVFLLLEIKNFVWILPAVFLTLLYSAPKIPLLFFLQLKRHIWGKTLLLAAMWTYITNALPLLAEHIAWKEQHWIFVLNRFALIFAICILFDIRDRDYDKTIGVKSIVTLLQARHIKAIFDVAILISILSGIVLYHYFSEIWLVVILVLPSVLTYFIYKRATKTLNDYLFYFTLDGLMALSPILYFAQKIF